MKKKKELSVYYYPDKDEIRAAQLACCGRHCNACESPAEYAWRKREVDMALLLERAIISELTDAERTAVKLHWFKGESITQISDEKDISPSAVKRTLDRANEKLEKALSYVVYYQQNVLSESVVPLAVGRARVIAAARNALGKSAGERIALLRQSQCLTVEALCFATRISLSRLKKIESGGDPDNSELVVLSEFFDVTTDYILKGEKNDKRENIA